MKLLAIALAASLPLLAKSPACNFSNDDLLKLQLSILKASEQSSKQGGKADLLWSKAVSHPLRCLMEAQLKSEGLTKYYAGSLLRPLLGEPLVDGMPQDPRFEKVAKRLQRLTLANGQLTSNSLLTHYAEGDWGFWNPCEHADKTHCPVFIPDEKAILNQSPLVASAQMLHLKKAYFQLAGKEKRDVAELIRTLYKKTPIESTMKRQVIDQIYSEIFAIPLRQS